MKKMVLGSILCLAVLFLLPISGISESLDSYLQLLQRNHHLIKAAKNKAEAAGHKKRAAKAGYYPSVQLVSDLGYESVDDELKEKTDLLKTSHTLRANQLLFDFGATTDAVEIAATEEKLSELEQLQTTQVLLYNGIQAYLDIARQVQRNIFANSTESNFSKQVEAETAMEQQGAGRSSDVLQVKAQLSGAVANRITVEGDLVLAKNKFEAVFQTALTSEEMVSFSLPAPPLSRLPATLEEAIAIAQDHNAGLLVEQQRAVAGKQEVSKLKTNNWPRLDLVAESKYTRNDQGIEKSLQENFLGVELKYALFSGGRDSAKILEAKSTQSYLDQRYKYARLQIEELVKNGWQKMRTLEQSSKKYEEQAVQTADFLLLARKERRLGSRSVMDVLNAENVYLSALNNAVGAQMNYLLSIYSVLHSTGRLDIVGEGN